MYLDREPHATHHCPKPCRAAIEADEAGGSSRGLPAEVSMRRLDVSDDEASPRDSLVSVSLNNPSGGDKPPPPSDAPSGTPAAWKAEPNQLKRALARKSRFYYMSVNSMPVQGLELCGNQPPRGFGQFTLPRPTSASSSQRVAYSLGQPRPIGRHIFKLVGHPAMVSTYRPQGLVGRRVGNPLRPPPAGRP